MNCEVVSLPVPGTVFVATSCPGRPMIVLEEDENHPGEILRLDIHGTSLIWGDLKDWRDELRRGTIRVVYTPE